MSMLKDSILRAQSGVALLETVWPGSKFVFARRFTLITADRADAQIFDNFSVANAAYEHELSRHQNVVAETEIVERTR